MVNINKLLLLSGNEVPFRTGRCNIHQPSIDDISYIGEEMFYIGTHFLLFDKNDLKIEDKNDLTDQSNFNIFMSVMNSKDYAKHKTGAMLVLTLMFPDMQVKIDKNKLLLQKENFESSINEYNFEDFQSIVRQIFCLEELEGNNEKYNPADDMARKIAEKIQKANKKKAEQKENDKEINLFGRYISILAVGLHKDINSLMQYKVYQLMDEFERFRMKEEFDMYLKAKVAGAQDLEEVKNWMEDIHT